MLQQEKAEDFVIGTGESHSVREFCELAFNHVGLNYQDYVVQDQHLYRPSEVDFLISDSSKAKQKLGWESKTVLKELVDMMVDADLKRIEN